MRRDDIVARAERVPGWMMRSELTWLADHAAALPEGAIWCELGVNVGRSLLAVGLSLPPHATLIAIDKYLLQQELQDHHLADTLRELLEQRPDVEVRLLRRDTLAAACLLRERLDVVFIDSSHELDATLAEIAVYRPMLKAGGLLCGHDYTPAWPGVVAAVDRAFYGTALVAPGTTIWAHREPLAC